LFLGLGKDTTQTLSIKELESYYLQECLLSSGTNSFVLLFSRYTQSNKSRWGWDFSHTPRPALGHTQPPVQWVQGLSRG
jgi:hypothetical protein